MIGGTSLQKEGKQRKSGVVHILRQVLIGDSPDVAWSRHYGVGITKEDIEAFQRKGQN